VKRTIAGAVLVALVAVTAALAPPGAARAVGGTNQQREVPCTPGRDGCIPTPAECALGGYEGHWDGGTVGRFADCVGGGGHVVHYVGGYLGTDGAHLACGAIIDADQVIAGGWTDPNVCAPASAPPGHGVAGRALPPLVTSAAGVVASDSPVAADIGVRVLDDGGNAVDAAVATVFALGVTRPDVCGLGGVGALVYRPPHGPAAALDFIATAPAAVTSGFWRDRPEPAGIDGSGTGHRVVGVPGVVAGLAAALQRFGTTSLAGAIAPAASLAATGTVVESALPGATAATYSGTPVPLVGIPRVRMFPETARAYLRGGVLQYPPDNPLAPSTIVQPALARSLQLVANHGVDAFYRDTTYPEGPSIGHLLLSDMHRAANAPSYPGDAPLPWQASDLTDYQAVWRTPLSTTYRGYKVDTIGGGTAGGYLIAEELNILEGFPLGTAILHSSADHLHLVAEAAKLAQRDAYQYVGDPAFVPVPTGTLTSKEFAAQRRSLIESRAQDYDAGTIATAPSSPATAAGEGATIDHRSRATHTSNISVIDRSGGAVAVTCSLGNFFGSAVVAPGTGFALNDALINFNEPGNVNEPAGGKRALWALSPTIVSKAGTAVLATGAAGGGMIPGAVVASISNTIDFGMDLAHAIDAARVSEMCVASCPADGSTPGMVIEEGRVPPQDVAELQARGHELVEQGEYAFLADVQAVGTDLASGRHVGASDPRPAAGRGARAQRSG
jgi:gamma-glutamyltranspeptidase/glutathione hydrolase